jgi:hypothetical protein
MAGIGVGRAQAAGALHSRTIENKMAAAKRVKVRRFARITSLSQFVP